MKWLCSSYKLEFFPIAIGDIRLINDKLKTEFLKIGIVDVDLCMTKCQKLALLGTLKIGYE